MSDIESQAAASERIAIDDVMKDADIMPDVAVLRIISWTRLSIIIL